MYEFLKVHLPLLLLALDSILLLASGAPHPFVVPTIKPKILFCICCSDSIEYGCNNNLFVLSYCSFMLDSFFHQLYHYFLVLFFCLHEEKMTIRYTGEAKQLGICLSVQYDINLSLSDGETET